MVPIITSIYEHFLIKLIINFSILFNRKMIEKLNIRVPPSHFKGTKLPYALFTQNI